MRRPNHAPPRQQRGEAVTLEQIRAALPTHIMLTENVHIWQPDDEWRFDGVGWELISVNWWGKPVDIGCARRPIPPHILDNQAFCLLLDKGFKSRDHFADKAENLGIVRKLGGLDNYRAQTKAGRLYDKWLLEQIESGG